MAQIKKEDVGLPLENSSGNRRNQFRPRPGGKQGTTSYQLRQYAEATLGGGSLRKIVKLPEGEDENEWFAVNSKRRIWEERDCGYRNDHLTPNHSGRLLQPGQPSLRRHHRVLLSTVMSGDEGHR